MKYVPTHHLRFVEREIYDTPTTAHRAKVLQQGWVREHIGGFIEWRDVPLVVEASKDPVGAVRISIDGKPIAVRHGTDVLNIKAAADIPGIYCLVQERLGQPDLQLNDSDFPELKGGEVFYSVPPTNNG